MKKKILFSLLFVLILFIVILTGKASAVSVEYQGSTYDFGEDLDLYDYNFIHAFHYYGKLQFVRLISTSVEPIFEPLSDGTEYIVKFVDIDFKSYQHDSDGNVVNGPSGTNYTSDFCSFTSDTLLYCDYDIKDENGNIIFPSTVVAPEPVPEKYFNFKYNGTTYSLNVTNCYLRDNICIFKYNNNALVFTSEDRPKYKYYDKNTYLHTSDSTSVYLFDLATGDEIYSEDYPAYYENGTDQIFYKNSLIYSNFVLYDDNDQVVFQPLGTTLAIVLKAVEPIKVLQEVLGLVPVILILIVTYLALRKAIAELVRKVQI